VYAFVQDVPASWEQYPRLVAAVEEPPPAGLIVHVAGPTDEGFRVIAVWESEAAWKQFRTGREQGKPEVDVPVRAAPSFRGLHSMHAVVGAARPPIGKQGQP